MMECKLNVCVVDRELGNVLCTFHNREYLEKFANVDDYLFVRNKQLEYRHRQVTSDVNKMRCIARDYRHKEHNLNKGGNSRKWNYNTALKIIESLAHQGKISICLSDLEKKLHGIPPHMNYLKEDLVNLGHFIFRKGTIQWA